MVDVILNGQRRQFAEGTTILEACRRSGIEIPTLCHDDRIQPSGGCRLCAVEIAGWDRHPTACNTVVGAGMDIQTHSPAVERVRKTLLGLLAQEYPAEAIAAEPDRPFHRLLGHYGVRASGVERDGERSGAPFRDASHPYLHADFSRCIRCDRCVRICDELQGQSVWTLWNRGDRTVIRPGTAESLLTSPCVSCGACADTCPTGAIEDQSVRRLGAPDRWTRTVCPYCGTGCEMEVGTRAGRIVQIVPSQGSPVSKGHLCVKGRYAFDFVHAPDRVVHPMIRVEGRWHAVTWAEALDTVAARLGEIVAAAGPDSVGMLGSARGTNEENYVVQKFARVVLGTNNVDCCARVCHAPTAAGMKQVLGTGAATNSFDDIERAAGFLLVGCNPTENHPVVGARIRARVRAGAPLVVIDPRRTELAACATVHLQPHPGTNIPLLHALAFVLLEEHRMDPEFLTNRVTELSAFRDFIRNWTPGRAEALTGVPAAEIRRAARVYAASRPAMMFHGLGVTEHLQGTDGVRALINLALLTGNLGIPGGGVNPLRGQNNVQGSAHMGCDPGSLPGGIPLDAGRAEFQRVLGVPLPERRGLNLLQMIDAADQGRLRALWAVGYDIAMTNPDRTATARALGKLEFVVVQDLFLNELARDFAQVFLPACSSFEKGGTFMNSERRVQRVRAALPPVGESLADWRIVCEVAARMGFQDSFAFRSEEDIWDEVRRLWPDGAGMTYERLEETGLQWPCPTESHPGTTILHASAARTWPLSCVPYQESPEHTDASHPFLLTTGRTLHQFNAGTMTQRTPNRLLCPEDTLHMAPEDAASIGVGDGAWVTVSSRHGTIGISVKVDPAQKAGEVFTTFHGHAPRVNELIGPHRDDVTQTPDYKRVAVSIVKRMPAD